MLTGADGLTLYRFTPEAGTKIACIGTCATTWPPLLMPTGDPVGTGLPAPLGTVMRPDGGRQVTHNGWPLYRFHLDAAPGDAKGQGIAGKWFAATPGDPPA
jgi:predicted lipoprotein with Yx(FWY)xxD motif